LCEAEFKRKKVELEKGVLFTRLRELMCTVAKQGDADSNPGGKESDDLEMIGGTSEDDFSEAIALVRFFSFSMRVADIP
jgi:hypothetical protein